MAVSARKVLVVDDDADWREFVSVSLSELGYQPLEAQDGEAALALVEAERPAVMLLDLHMPGMNGEQVVARLPKDGGPRAVLLTSAPSQEAAGALASGAYYYLHKVATRCELALLLPLLSLQ